MAHSKFFHFFPVPSFLRMPAAGISIDDSGARFVHLAERDGTVSVDRFGEIEFPEGAISSGEIKDKTAVVKALSQLQKEHDLKFIRATISDDKVYLFKLSLPILPENEIRSALEFKIEENVPISASEALFDYAVTGRNEMLGKINAVVIAVAKTTAEAYLDVLKSSSLLPLRLELESQAIVRASVPRDEKGAVLFAQFNEKKTGLFLVENGIVQFSLTLPVENGASAAVSDKPAEKYKKLTLVHEEIGRILDYWHDTESNVGGSPEYAVLAGGAEALDHEFIEYFSSLIGKPVAAADPWVNLDLAEADVKPIAKQDSFKYAAAIGAALENA